VIVPDKGMFRINFFPENREMVTEHLYSNISELGNAVDFTRVSEKQFVVFSPNRILILGKSGIIAKIPFPFGVIQKVSRLGTGRWLIRTVLNRGFVLMNGQLIR